jgi:hypothetical protein
MFFLTENKDGNNSNSFFKDIINLIDKSGESKNLCVVVTGKPYNIEKFDKANIIIYLWRWGTFTECSCCI